MYTVVRAMNRNGSRFCAVASFALLLLQACAEPSTLQYILHERRDGSIGSVKRVKLGDNMILPIRIGLVQSNLNNGDDLLMEVYETTAPDLYLRS